MALPAAALVHLVIDVDLTCKLCVNRVTDDSSADNNCKPLDFIVSNRKKYNTLSRRISSVGAGIWLTMSA